MENLKGICDFDTETGIATVYVHHDCAEEIINKNIGNIKDPALKSEEIEYLEYLLGVVPEEFNMKVSMTIDDYQGYDPQALIRAYDRALEIKDYSEKSYHKKKKVLMTVFILFGLALLILMTLAQKNGWFAPGGKALNVIMIIIIELLFEVYFEESFIFFTVSKGYQKLLKLDEERFLGITLNV